jgi:putative ABC transport system ATP-binding protein
MAHMASALPIVAAATTPQPGVGGIHLRAVEKAYRVGAGLVRALDGVDLDIAERCFVAVLGPSGSGKTTLLNIIGALDSPTAGRVEVGGIDVTSAPRSRLGAVRRHSVSFVFQTFNLFAGLNALENVEFGAQVAGRRDSVALASRTLVQVGLGDRMRHFPHELSGGEQQRVAIARALATGNPIMLADEPTGELDFRTGVQILALLHQQARAGKTVLLVTHNREIARAADRVVELSSGRIVSDAPPRGGPIPVADLRW